MTYAAGPSAYGIKLSGTGSAYMPQPTFVLRCVAAPAGTECLAAPNCRKPRYPGSVLG